MRLINYLQTKLPVLAVFGLALALTSCGSYQYVGQNSDGIYGDNDERQVQSAPEKEQETTGNNYYKNYFKEKSLEMEAESQENEVFVDIDSYQGNYSDENAQEENYGAWGENSQEVTINVYDNGFGWNNWGWNRWGWNNRPWGSFGFGYGGLWGTAFYNPYLNNNWGYGYCNPYYNNGLGNYWGYGNGYYYGYRNNGRGVAYNSTRRGRANTRYASNSRRNVRSNNSITRSRTRSSINRSNLARRVRANSSSNTPTRPQIKRTRTRNNSSTVRPTRSTPRTNRSYNPSRNSTRNSSPSRSSTRSSSPSRSSGATRSSGSSSSRRGRG